jgi:cytochrome c oxidase subunit 4
MSSLAQSNEVPAPVADDVSGHGHHPEGAHAVPKRILIGVYLLLCMFTIITVAVSKIDLGPANIWLALFVAVIKASLVVLFFMHIWWDSPFNGVVLIIAMFFVALFIGISMLDTKEYGPNFAPPQLVTELNGSTPAAAPGGESGGPEVPGLLSQAQVDDIKKTDSSTGQAVIRTMSYDDVVAAAAADKGDARLGMALFQSVGCVKCHTVNKSEPSRGPLLLDVVTRHPNDPGYIFESVLRPSAKIAAGFETHYFKLSSQPDPIEGFLVGESADTYSVRDVNGQVTTFPKSLVTKQGIRAKSAMAENLADGLTVHDLASIYAFLDKLSNPSVGE